MLIRSAVLTLIACLFARAGIAQQPPSLSPDIEAVETDGYWTVAGTEGTYRVIITTGGFEEITSQTYLQWITNPGPDDEAARIDTTVALVGVGEGIFHLSHPRFVRRNGRWLLLLDGVSVHTPAGKHEEWVITLGAPGVYSVRRTPHPPWPGEE